MKPLPLLATVAVAACALRRPAPGPDPVVDPREAASSVRCGDYTDALAGERTPLEARAWSEVQRALRGTGTAVRPSTALDRAARALALHAARDETRPLARADVQDALRVAGAWDPSPTAHLATGAADAVLAALLARLERNDATHVGVGDQDEGGVHHVVLLFARRRARLDPFPGAVPAGGERVLRGELQGLLHPRAFVTRPDGASEEIGIAGDRSFAARLRFDLPGLYTVEILGTGERGPEVAALLGVSVGGAACGSSAPPPIQEEPRQIERAEAMVVDTVNRTRREHGLAPLSAVPELGLVARGHSERMRDAGAVAHVLPADGDLPTRLGAARISYRRAWENVASGATALEAHAAIEASPAHRGNLLVREATVVGVGIARGSLPTGERVVYLTEILTEPVADAREDRLGPEARAREAIWSERARRSLPPLTSDPSLEALAREAALAMRASDRGEVGGLAEAALRLGRGIAAADAFIATSPAEAIRSRNLLDPRFRHVGVAAVVGDSRRWGARRLFIAVVYSD